MRRRKDGSILARLLVVWWLIVIVGFGIIGNGFIVIRLLQAGEVTAALMFGICFGGGCVYLYRTFNSWDEIRGIFK